VRISGHPMNTQVGAALAVGLIAMPVAAAPGQPVATATGQPVAAATGHPVASRAAPAVPSLRGPSLAISVSDGRAAATIGDRLTYTVSIRDTGAAGAPHLKITQTLSAGLEFVSASGHGVARAGQIAWSASLPAGGTRTFRAVALVTRTPARVLRLAAVACAALPGGGAPIVCAAHLDQLPAAAAGPATESGPAAAGSSGSKLLAYAGGGLAVLVAGLLTVIAGRRIRLRRPQA
jgi:uncharacterized repeat protein (TIGR01451 family)